MQTKIKIFSSGRQDGIMSRNAKFYDEEMTQEEIDEKFQKTRINLGKKYGFDGKKMFQVLQKTNTNGIDYKDGKYIVLTKEYMTKDDFWYEVLPADILMITQDYKGIVVGHQMADCPIVIAEDRLLGVTALTHCGVTYIDRKLPKQLIDALIEEFQSRPENIYVTIGSCAKKEHYIYTTYPVWATDHKVWDNYIIKQEDGYHLDIAGAIVKQLEDKNITHIDISPKDTITDPKFYSHKASIEGQKDKFGQNFVGFFYK